MSKKHKLFYCSFILFIAAISIAITMQGWRSRITAFDLLPYIYNVRNFLQTGTLPQYGDIGSYGSFSPPGTAWLILPGEILFRDTRLAEYLGAALLQITTLVGVFLLVRSYFGTRCSVLAVVLYGLGESALFFAGSLWPIGRPDFYIWVVYFASRWVIHKDSRYLAAALAVWGFGMYVDMAILPVIFIIPAIWVYYRLKIQLKPVLLAGLFILAVWLPFLRFEAPRGFADLRSQLFLQSVFPGNYRTAWCNPNLELHNFQNTASLSQSIVSSNNNPTLLSVLLNKIRIDRDNLLTNFEPDSQLHGISYLLLLLTLCSLLVLSVSGFLPSTAKSSNRNPSLRLWLKWIAIGCIVMGLLVFGFILVYLWIFRNGSLPGSRASFVLKLSIMLVFGGVALVLGPWLTKRVNNILVRLRVAIQTDERRDQIRLLVFSLIIPWLILLLISEPDKPERFVWLWPMQSIFLAAFFTEVFPRFKLPRFIINSSLAVIVLIVVINPFLLSRLDSWRATGWAGQDADEIKVSDFIAQQLEVDGKDQARIGYRVFFYPFMADYNLMSPTYKVGAEIDLILLFWHRITNTDQCAEGVADNDEFRIVETRPEPGLDTPRNYFDTSDLNQFHLIYQVGSYQVYRRD